LAAHLREAPGVATPGALDPAVFDAMMALPIGWTHFPPTPGADFALQVAGWIITASTALFGAPFWFDLMQRVVRLRSTGTRPDDLPLSLRVEGKIAAAATPLP
jgi:hypothetical protein